MINLEGKKMILGVAGGKDMEGESYGFMAVPVHAMQLLNVVCPQ